MMSRGTARVAAFQHYRHNDRTTLLVGRITSGPKTEMGRDVRLIVTKNDLPALRELIGKLESS